jgi:hypothetical protein|tara:strand:+ start:425 stop:604 length:180 start_codon:yes stop_codon:yes gene_type:complete
MIKSINNKKIKLLKFDREKWKKKLNKLSKDDLVDVLLNYEFDRIAKINTFRLRNTKKEY